MPVNEQGSPISAHPAVAEPNATTGGYSTRPAVAVLLVSPCEKNQQFFSSIFELPYWKAYRAHTYHEALKWLARDRMTLIICDSHLGDGTWKDILSQTQILPNPPCVVVTAEVPDDLLWAEVLNMGGYDLLAGPLVREEVVCIAELASMNWHREAENRGYVPAPRKGPGPAVSPRRAKPRTAAAGWGTAAP